MDRDTSTLSSEDTIRIFKQAYLSLARKKESAKITVTELVNRAGFSRGTFYLYYDGIESLKQEMQYNLLQRIYRLKARMLARSLPASGGKKSATEEHIELEGRLMQEHFEEFYVFLCLGRDWEFREEYKRFIGECLTCFASRHQETVNQEALDYLVEASYGLILHWLEVRERGERAAKEDNALLNSLLLDMSTNLKIMS